jgi:uroporphyrinogen-III synthase
MTRVLVLRPEPGASETADRARALGLRAVASPLFTLEAVAWHAPDPASFDALLLTSTNAVRHGGEQLESLWDLPVYAVGEATAASARAARFSVVHAGESGVEQLLQSLPFGLRLLHLCGVDRKEAAGARQSITHLAVYRAVPIEAPDLSAIGGSVALVHSPRAGRRLAELVRDRSRTAIAAISPAAVEAVGRGWRTIEPAERPTDDALLALAARLCDNPQPK